GFLPVGRRCLLMPQTRALEAACRTGLERRNECSLQSTQMSSDVRAEVSAQGAPVTVQQNLEIPSRLRRLDDAECVFLIRHGQVESVVARDLEEHARVRSALIGLAGRVQETRSELQARRDVPGVPGAVAYRLQLPLVRLGHLDVCQERKVVARPPPARIG